MSDSYEDELADLIGKLPDEEPPNPFDTLQALLDAPADLRAWGMRQLAKGDPAGALEAVLPAYSDRDRVEFAVEYKRQRRSREARQMLDELESRQRTTAPPDMVSLTTFLAESDEEVCYRVAPLWPR